MVKNIKNELSRIWSALITPMNADESVNYDALRKITRRQLKAGVEGFYVCGSSGQALLLDKEERKKVLETVLDEAAGSVPVISHVGTIRTADVRELARHAMDAGAMAVSMIPPYYYRFSAEEIRNYYLDVIRSVPDAPVIIYNIPQFTGIEFSKENAGELFKEQNIAGIKHTSTNLYSMERMMTAFPDLAMINGFDEQFIGALEMGATATIGTTVNLFSKSFIEARDAWRKGDTALALKIQRKINERVEKTVSVGIFNAMMYGETLLGTDCGFCRAPFIPLTEEQKKVVEGLIAEL